VSEVGVTKSGFDASVLPYMASSPSALLFPDHLNSSFMVSLWHKTQETTLCKLEHVTQSLSASFPSVSSL
jgi:hypothetical protein